MASVMNFYTRYIAICGLLLNVLFTYSQYDENVRMRSGLYGANIEVPIITLPRLNMQDVTVVDELQEAKGHLPLFSRNVACNVSLNNNIFLKETTHEGYLYRIQLSASGAKGLVLLFNKLYLPQSATLHVYSPDKRQVIGAYTHDNTPHPTPFNAGIMVGENAVIEYFEPYSQTGMGVLEITEIGYAYRWMEWLYKNGNQSAASGSCEVNVACSEANNWQDQKRSVARIVVASNQGQGFCTGALVNNQRQDCTPYFLSAQHCTEGTTTAQYAQYIFYFGYESSLCNGTSGPTNKTVNGCTKISDSNDNGGASGSDFVLLQLSSTPPSNYNVYYAGWNNGTTAPTSGVCIHHPDGDIKKISTYSSTATSTAWGSMSGSHWDVQWVATTNGHGVTEPGSSGSPLFNQNGEIVGTLTGGDSYCNTPNNPDQFGKLNKHWTANGTANNRRLKPWLDPDNTEAVSIGGTNFPCGSLVANDAGISAILSPLTVVCTTSFAPSITLKNFGSNTLTTVTINYTIDGNVFQYVWNGNLSSGGSTTVSLPVVSLSTGQHSISFETASPNNTSDGNTANDAAQQNFTVGTSNLNLYIKTDTYGDETTWQITNSSNAVVSSGGPYVEFNGGKVYNENVCLAPGCYTLTFFDSYDDGMDDGQTTGTFKLTGVGGSPVYAELSNPQFGTSVSYSFCIQASGLDKETFAVAVYPNPSTDVFVVNADVAGEKLLRVYNQVGQLVNETYSNNTVTYIKLATQAGGVYFLYVKALSTGAESTAKLIVR